MDEAVFEKCALCPRQCGADRRVSTGFCGAGTAPYLARAALHFWEEPCVSGTRGSGAIFFSGCSLRCVYCQNREISRKISGKKTDTGRLEEIFFELKDQGAANINLVTADIYLPVIAGAIEAAKRQGIGLPFLLNTSSYITVDCLRQLEGLIDVYLPDMKYFHEKDAARYSGAGNYVACAKAAIDEMVRQRPRCLFAETPAGERLLMCGVLIRHLLLPGKVIAAKQIVKYLHERYGDSVYLSLLNQYTPNGELSAYPELDRGVYGREYKSLVDYAVRLGVENAYVQEASAAGDQFLPAFDGSGV